MAYKLIEEFNKDLNGHDIATFTGALSPLLVTVPWSRNPEIPITTICISKGEELHLIADEYYYHLCSEDVFRKYVEKKVTKKELLDAYTSYASSAQTVYDKVVTLSLSTIDEKELLDLLNKVIHAFEPVADTVYIETLNYDMALRVLGEARKAVLDKVWENSIHPTFLSFEGRWLSKLIELVKGTEDPQLLVRKVKYIYTDYHWTKNETEILSKLQDVKNNLAEKQNELETIYNDTEKRKSEYNAWFATLSDEEKYISEYIQMIMMLRDLRKDPIAQSQANGIEIHGRRL